MAGCHRVDIRTTGRAPPGKVISVTTTDEGPDHERYTDLLGRVMPLYEDQQYADALAHVRAAAGDLPDLRSDTAHLAAACSRSTVDLTRRWPSCARPMTRAVGGRVRCSKKMMTSPRCTD
jgi:hypothetical protein